MEGIPQKSAKEVEAQLVLLKQREEIAAKAFELTLNQFLDAEDEAAQMMELAWRLLNYEYEQAVYSVDTIRLRLELDPTDDRSPFDLEAMEDDRQKNESALIKARLGDYKELKSCLRKESLIDEIALGGDEKIEQLFEKIDQLPNSGPVLPLPKPAWMDPRFNGENESLEEKD